MRLEIRWTTTHGCTPVNGYSETISQNVLPQKINPVKQHVAKARYREEKRVSSVSDAGYANASAEYEKDVCFYRACGMVTNTCDCAACELAGTHEPKGNQGTWENPVIPQG
jgi:hypothetical protein